ncbi:MAG: phosphotransferase, partial [Candidatus Diapherotrites archaeon]|nr:phosphotransferase [Candidatus Diapherotrites archaeon]
LGREWNRIRLAKPDFQSLSDALWQRDEPQIEFNAGLNPREGKYHATACNACYLQYPLAQAGQQFKWKCPNCGGEIKRGVKDRIEMLADLPVGKHPAFRPPYRHTLPLAEIIQHTLGQKNVLSPKVQSKWADFIERFGNEIRILIDVPQVELVVANPEIGKKIVAFRNGLVHYTPGGGGKYGEPHLFDSKEEMEEFIVDEEKRIREKNRFSGQTGLGRF